MGYEWHLRVHITHLDLNKSGLHDADDELSHSSKHHHVPIAMSNAWVCQYTNPSVARNQVLCHAWCCKEYARLACVAEAVPDPGFDRQTGLSACHTLHKLPTHTPLTNNNKDTILYLPLFFFIQAFNIAWWLRNIGDEPSQPCEWRGGGLLHRSSMYIVW